MHVDDFMMACNTKGPVQTFVKSLPWPTQDFGPLDSFLSVTFKEDVGRGTVSLNQEGSVRSFISKHELNDDKRIPIIASANLKKNDGKAPQSRIDEYLKSLGALIYFSIQTYPELAYAVSKLGSFASNPSAYHLKVLKNWLCPYLKKGLSEHKLIYSKAAVFDGKKGNDPAVQSNGLLKSCDQSVFGVEVFCDANFIDSAGAKDHAKSRSGMCVMMCGGAVFWHSKLQGITARHTQEAEYVSLSDACRFGLIVKQFLF